MINGVRILDRSTFSMSYNEYIALLSSGRVLGMFDQAWDFATATYSLIDAGMYENTFIALPLVYDPEYVDGKIIEEHYLTGGAMGMSGFGISVTCPYPERLVQMMDTFLSDEWQILFQWGVEGEDYYVENGRMLMTEEQYAHLSDPEWKSENKAEAVWLSCPAKQGTMDNGNSWDPEKQPELYYRQLNEYDQQFLAACGKRTPGEFFNPPLRLAPYGEAWQISIDPIYDAYSKFRELQSALLPTVILCDPSELDDNWNAFTERIRSCCTAYSEYMQEEVLKLVKEATE